MIPGRTRSPGDHVANRAVEPGNARTASRPKRTTRSARPRPAPDQNALAALIADPETIAGGSPLPPSPTRTPQRKTTSAKPAPRPKREAVRKPTEPSWERRALVERASRPATRPVAPATAARPATDARPAAERALLAELREARATLAIARETTQIQREEIARLREALARAEARASETSARALASDGAPPVPPPAATLETAERLARAEAELAARDLEREAWRERVCAVETALAERGRQLDAMQTRFDVQGEALEQARRQADQERRRHTEAQALLDRLRSTLRDASDADAPAPEPAPTVESKPTNETHVVATTTASRAEIALPHRPWADSRARPAIFDHWRDDQIRRHFGPLGIECATDLLRDPLARRARRAERELAILALGRGGPSSARSLVEAMIRSGAPPVVLHAADPAAPATLARARQDDPLAGSIQPVAEPRSAAELAALVGSISPAVIVLQDFLTDETALDDWLDVLAAAEQAGSAIVLLDEVGSGPVGPSAALESLGQRIWALLPERYTLDPESGVAITRFVDAFGAHRRGPGNGLLRALGQRFELELCARFGFLAEPFVAGPTARHLDPAQARDRRFLKQIADLDERQLESGESEPLHFVARIDGLAPR